MNTKRIIICGTILTVGTAFLYFWLEKRRLKSKVEEEDIKINEQPGWKPKTPKAFLKKLITEILEGDTWKNERDFLSTLTKLYIKEAPEVMWIDYLPMNQEDLLECLNDLGCLEGYEIELEKRYRRK